MKTKPHIYKQAGCWCVYSGRAVYHLATIEQAFMYASRHGRIYR